MKTQPRGIRNFNPGNIRWGDPWQGLVPKSQRSDTAFCQFQNAAYGIRALARTLITYQDKHGLHAIRQLISRWAPPEDNNNTQSYVHVVAKQTGFAPDQKLNLHDYRQLRAVAEAIIRVENGRGPLTTANTWYDEATVNKGLALAGVEPATRSVDIAAAKIPVTRETIGATATGGAGVAQIVDVFTSLPADTLTQASTFFTSGSTARLVLGVALLGIAAFIVWGQIQRHQSGTL